MNCTDRKLMNSEAKSKDNADTMKNYLNPITKFSDFESTLIVKDNNFNR